MIEVQIDALPDGFNVVAEDRPGMATVIYDVTPETFGTWIGVSVANGALQLFPERSYKHKDLMKRLGMPVSDEG